MNTFGENIKITVFGESHGPAVGVVLDGLPAGESIDEQAVRQELKRRAPGSSELGSPRNEGDEPVFLSGLFGGRTTGAPVSAIIKNTDTDASGYDPDIMRPGHADLTARIKFRGFSDYRGGGPFSGRLMAPVTLAGGICRQILHRRGVKIEAGIVRVGQAAGEGLDYAMQKEILDARASGDSVGGIIQCVVEGVPAGTGGLMFGGLESMLAAMLYAIPGVKGVEFGAGFSIAELRGSAANDPIRVKDGKIYTETNNSGGINGGIANGMPIVFRVALRPTPTIGREQESIDFGKGENITMRGRGRHDPCLAPRAVPVVEAAAAFCVLDAMLGN